MFSFLAPSCNVCMSKFDHRRPFTYENVPFVSLIVDKIHYFSPACLRLFGLANYAFPLSALN